MGTLLLLQWPHAPAQHHSAITWLCYALLNPPLSMQVHASGAPYCGSQQRGEEWLTTRSMSSVVIPGLMAACALSRMVRAMWQALREPSICFAVLMGTAQSHIDHLQSFPSQRLRSDQQHPDAFKEDHALPPGEASAASLAVSQLACSAVPLAVHALSRASRICSDGDRLLGYIQKRLAETHPCSAVCFPSRCRGCLSLHSLGAGCLLAPARGLPVRGHFEIHSVRLAGITDPVSERARNSSAPLCMGRPAWAAGTRSSQRAAG